MEMEGLKRIMNHKMEKAIDISAIITNGINQVKSDLGRLVRIQTTSGCVACCKR